MDTAVWTAAPSACSRPVKLCPTGRRLFSCAAIQSRELSPAPAPAAAAAALMCAQVSMVGLFLRGLGHALQQPRNLAEAWAPYAERALREAGQLQAVQAEIDSWSE